MSDFHIHLAVLVCLNVVIVSGLAVIARTGQLSLGHGAFVGIAAYGAFFIPKSYGSSIPTTGGPEAALWGFFAFYLVCIAITWGVYTRRGGLLYDIEHARKTGPARV